MINSHFLKTFGIFTLLSAALGLATVFSPAVANLGWAIGTLISIFSGYFYGRGIVLQGRAIIGGAMVGGGSIFLGCLLAYVMRSMPIEGVIAATLVGIVSGAAAAFIAKKVPQPT
jgi:hypothetical protein